EFDILGYLPKRNDYEREFDSMAETLVANLSADNNNYYNNNYNYFNDVDIENKFKIAQIDMYQRRLIQRIRKKSIVCENNLIARYIEKTQKNDFSKENLKKDFQQKFLPFMRYLRRSDCNYLVNDLIEEHVLKIIFKKLIKSYL